MVDLTCDDVRDAAAEYALDIIAPEERSAVAAHLLRCASCRLEVAAMEESAARLLDIVPGTEPPLGFDRRVLDRIGSPLRRNRQRARIVLTAAAAALIAIAATLGIDAGRSPHPHPVVLASAYFVQGDQRVGQLQLIAGNPQWLSMTVRGVSTRGEVTCEAIGRDGSVTKIGSFDLVGGSGSWGAPDRWPSNYFERAELVDSSGHVIATAAL